ncbi:hypothetical protein MMC25_003526 [Agyrium rufum]|nr:hypothetical protein [Agyrium rufum]
MTFLRNGGSAVDAVEVAIRVLEDQEITNAGYGSNLAMDGTVECDASIVDHFGRSGAVAALGQVKNPIHVARLVLENSTRPMSLRRVPPNLLVANGAADFAFEHGVPLLPPDALISYAARERWYKWKKDLDHVNLRAQRKADQRARDEESLENEEQTEADEEEDEEVDPQSESLPEPLDSHLAAGTWNESQPHSPRLGPASPRELDQPISKHGYGFNLSLDPQNRGPNDGSVDYDDISNPVEDGENRPSVSPYASAFTKLCIPTWPSMAPILSNDPMNVDEQEDDAITDTVGAIAVDCFGNIAAASSSGGIGMKHNGRAGPAALVGIGTAVLPIEIGDKSKTCVATVTSGTGEHMATTLAAQTCASRLYFNEMKGKDGRIRGADEEDAIRGFVDRDFMNHPSVLHSHSAGAIGVMCVKKSRDGIWLHFAHNTDSFALASMHSDEKEPVCVMSRGPGNSTISTGARSIRARTRPAPKTPKFIPETPLPSSSRPNRTHAHTPHPRFQQQPQQQQQSHSQPHQSLPSQHSQTQLHQRIPDNVNTNSNSRSNSQSSLNTGVPVTTTVPTATTIRDAKDGREGNREGKSKVPRTPPATSSPIAPEREKEKEKGKERGGFASGLGVGSFGRRNKRVKVGHSHARVSDADGSGEAM